jgi:hypothetical protein
MGLFSKVMDFTGIGQAGKMLRTGATKAARDAKAAGETSLAEQQALKQEIGGIYDPRMQAGNQAFGELADFYGGNQQTIIDQAQASPFMSSLVEQGAKGVAQNAQMTGGLRTGTANENFAQNNQNVLMSLVQQMLQGKQGIAQAGYGATDAYTNAMQNITAGVGATRGQIANVDINKAAQRGNQIGGLAQAGASIYGASDIALKTNIVQDGVKNGLNWYRWDWNKLAEDIGLTGSEEGHIAQEVQAVRPDLVTTQDGYLAVNYGGF